MHRHYRLISFGVMAAAVFSSEYVHGDCTFVTGAGNDTYLCDSGTAPLLTDLVGNNSLTLPIGGTGVINGSVIFGPGRDTVLVQSGAILGAVQQGSGIDNFIMSDGRIQALSQGDGLDTFLMTGGTLVGAFEDGDIARMSGGTIGRVDMKLDDNVFEMSEGRINGNLVAGFGRDTVTVSGGSIGGNISISGGNDVVTITGGVIGGNVLLSFGDDNFTWRDGGVIDGTISLAAGNDTALLSGLTEDTLSATNLVYGDAGVDVLTFDNTSTATGSRYSYWETINLTNGSVLDLPNRLSLADDSTPAGSGVLNIDATSILGSTQGTVGSVVTGQNVTVKNAGLIDLTRSGDSVSDRLTIVGNYVGDNARMNIQSVLAGDDAESDRLVVSQGTLSGSTAISVSNVNGLGAQTHINGIEVVQANSGAISSHGAFSLANNLSVGAYQYYLFKGGVTAGSENSWYLRSTVIAPPAAPPVPEPPVVPPPVVEPPVEEPPVVQPPVVQPPVAQPPIAEVPPVVDPAPVDPSDPNEIPAVVAPPAVQPEAPVVAAPGPAQPAASVPVAAVGTPVLPAAIAGEAIVLYRIEVPAYTVAPPAAALLALTSLGTFHERQGEQSLLSEHGAVPAGWARTFGSHTRQKWSGDTAPTFDGNVGGYQVGHDLFATLSDNGYRQHAGLFVGHARLSGDVRGFALGFEDNRSGDIRLEGDSLGAYWTLVAPNGAYLDAVAMGTRFDGRSRSQRGYKLELDGHGVALSLEGGYPIAMTAHWVVEPQAQLIVQKIDLDSARDPVSDVAFDSQEYLRARAGVRLKGAYEVNGTPVEPYVRANLWHTFDGKDTVTFDNVDRLKTEHASTTAQIGAGIAARLSQDVSVYAGADYGRNLDTQPQEALQGTLGIRISW